MRVGIKAQAIAGALCAAGLAAASSAYAAQVEAVSAARLLDVASGKYVDNPIVIITDGRITAVGKQGEIMRPNSGKLMLPESGDFGPCFRRTTGKFRRFDLGFEPKSLVGDVKTIRGLKPDSEAAKAGLKDDDVVTYSVAMDSVQGDQTRTLTLQVTRDGKTFPLTYLPRGEVVEAYQWARVPGVPDARCVS
mgnify:CR=1 FL=1